MARTGKGEIDAFLTNWRWEKDTYWAETSVLLYNFDVDCPDLKTEHIDFLNNQVIFYLDDSPQARVKIIGTARLTGESAHNEELSAKRGKAVIDHLRGKKIDPVKFAPPDPIALGDAPAGPAREDKRDRSVTLDLKFPITIEDLYLLLTIGRIDWIGMTLSG